ncbi:MAG: hypothetical protein JNL50_08200 [Phycisphaerae bacterium]|nr:hypothetical protein [Phycisphaerae bacterium]
MDPKLLWGLGLIGASLLLLILEVFIPSMGVLFVTAVVTALAGVVTLFTYDPVWGVSGLLAVLVLGPMVGFSALNIWKNTPIGRRMIGSKSEAEREEEKRAEVRERDQMLALVGAEGETLTDLRPVGVARFDGKRLDVTSELGLIVKGTRVRITAVEGTLIKVQEVS